MLFIYTRFSETVLYFIALLKKPEVQYSVNRSGDSRVYMLIQPSGCKENNVYGTIRSILAMLNTTLWKRKKCMLHISE